MTKPKSNESAQFERTCGNCFWMEFDDQEKSHGECYESPPRVAVIEDSPYAFRPTVGASERACSRFKLRHDA